MTSPTHQVCLRYQGQEYRFRASSQQTVLAAALEQGIPLPYSCRAGVCTTCAGRLSQGTVAQEAAMGISPDLQEQGYVLYCVAYPMSDLEGEAGQEDEVYELQFGAAHRS
ncbi:MAG: 2Fe-2S iron-sulfur cluster-binding protein [Cyanobacteriota bacterium]|nr:2Fe-2S iron-sulfur cluster-binding protein [Cyanobacteriota bacterium]